MQQKLNINKTCFLKDYSSFLKFLFCFKTLFAVYSENFLYGTLNVVKSNAGCNEFESNKVAKLQNVSRADEDKTRKEKKKKKNEEKNGRGRCGNSYTK